MPTVASPAPQVRLVTRWDQLAARIRSAALAHYIHALVVTMDDFFARCGLERGMDLSLAVGLLPDGKVLARAELSPNSLPQAVVAEFLDQVRELARPPVRGGPVAFVVQALLAGGRPDRIGPALPDKVPTDFATDMEKAEAACAPPRPALWSRALAGCRRALTTLHDVVFPRPVVKPAASEDCGLQEEFRTFERLTEMIAAQPHFANPYLWRAQLQQNERRYDGAIVDYDEYLARKPADTEARFNRGICHHSSGSREKALADYSEAISCDPRAAAVHMRRAWLYAELGAWEPAEQGATAAAEIDPYEPEWFLGRARMLATQGKFDAALADLDRTLQLDPHHVDAIVVRAMVYRDRPKTEEQIVPDWEAAITAFSAALHLDRNLVAAYANRGQLRQQTGDLEGALDDCNQALRLDPELGLAYAVRGHVRLRRGEPRQAIADCGEAIRLGTDGWLVQLTLADALLGENESEDALAACDAALKLSPQHAGALLLRARCADADGLVRCGPRRRFDSDRPVPAWNWRRMPCAATCMAFAAIPRRRSQT